MNYEANVAAEIALDEVANDRYVVILMRDQSQFRSLELAEYGALNLTMPRAGIFVRSATCHSSLISLAVDTLIIVGDCDPEGVELAKEHLLRGVMSPKVIVIPEIQVITGWEISGSHCLLSLHEMQSKANRIGFHTPSSLKLAENQFYIT